MALDWQQSTSRVIGALIGAPGRGDRRLLMLFNAEPKGVDFHLPTGDWQPLLDTADDAVGQPDDDLVRDTFRLAARSVALLAGAALPSPHQRTRPGA